MKISEWFLKLKKIEYAELKQIRQYRKSVKTIARILHKIFEELEKRAKVINIGQPVNIKNQNKQLIHSLKLLLTIENWEQHLLRHVLVESSTSIEYISKELGIQALHRGYKVNNVENSKRATFAILSDEEKLNKVVKKISKYTKNIQSYIEAYIQYLYKETQAGHHQIDVKVDTEYRKKLEKNLKQYILIVLAQSKMIAELKDDELKKESFLQMYGKTGLLIFHSYAHNPLENRDMAEYFIGKGFSVFSPRLPGHGTSEDLFYNTSMTEIKLFGQECVDYFYKKNNSQPIYIAGLSLGGMLALHLASQPKNKNKIKGIISINSFIRPNDPAAKVLEYIPYGSNIMQKLLHKTQSKFLKKKSVELIQRRRKDLRRRLSALIPMTRDNNKSLSYELRLEKEFEQRLDEDFNDIIQEQIMDRPAEGALIMRQYQAIKERAVNNFNERVKKGSLMLTDIKDITQLFCYEFYTVMTWKGMMELTQFADDLVGEMKHLTCGLLVVQSKDDKTVSPRSAIIIRNACTHAKPREIHFISDTGHLIILERKRIVLYKQILKFIEKIS